MREPAPAPRGAAFRAVGLLSAALALAAGALALWAADDRGRLERGGREYRVPVPPMSLRVGASDGAATYLALGRRSMIDVVGEGEARHGFRFFDQMGSHCVLLSDADRLDVGWQITASVFTRLEYRLRPR
jgi:hypothetical protein